MLTKMQKNENLKEFGKIAFWIYCLKFKKIISDKDLNKILKDDYDSILKKILEKNVKYESIFEDELFIKEEGESELSINNKFDENNFQIKSSTCKLIQNVLDFFQTNASNLYDLKFNLEIAKKSFQIHSKFNKELKKDNKNKKSEEIENILNELEYFIDMIKIEIKKSEINEKKEILKKKIEISKKRKKYFEQIYENIDSIYDEKIDFDFINHFARKYKLDLFNKT